MRIVVTGVVIVTVIVFGGVGSRVIYSSFWFFRL